LHRTPGALTRAGVHLLFLLLPCAPAAAQEKASLRVVVDGVGAEATACGLSTQAIQSVGQRSLKSHGVALSQEARDPYLYLHVNAYRVMQGADIVGCTTRIGVSVRARVSADAVLRSFRSKGDAYVVACEAGRLISGAVREMASAVGKGFEQDIKTCLAQLNY
jgi:hypothetical protein